MKKIYIYIYSILKDESYSEEEFGSIIISLDGESDRDTTAVLDSIKTRSNKILSILEKFEFILNKKGLVHNKSNTSNYNHNKGNSMIDMSCIYDGHLSSNAPSLLKRLSTGASEPQSQQW